MTAHIMFQGPSLICQDCRAEIGQHHKPGCPEAGVRPARPAPPDGEAALLIKLFDECARLEAYEDALRGEGSNNIFRTTAATQLLWTQVRLVASTYRALVASGALPEVDPSAGPPGVTRTTMTSDVVKAVQSQLDIAIDNLARARLSVGQSAYAKDGERVGGHLAGYEAEVDRWRKALVSAGR
jgi:hypothetical protein